MLLQRIITAVVLLIVLLLVSVFFPPVCFRLFVALASAIALWEWLRLTASAKAAWMIAVVYLIAAGWTAAAGFDDVAVNGAGVASATMPWAGWIQPIAVAAATLGVLFWTVVAPLILSRADTQRSPFSLLSSLAGVVVVGGSALALAMLHQQHGVWFIFSFLGVIWCADTFAYFGGKHFGGARLAPAISPGKTRSGAICGLMAAILWMLATLYIDGSFAGYMHKYFPVPLVLLVGAVLATYSMIGDLYESLIKRRAGIKDSSKLLPGHGGVWDRFDSIVSVTPLVLALWMLIRHFY
ncbi:MAG TPA: phosphatidate cytidylyltransferase [Advenella sp.]|nr:phosphatidate cytidylyltransferase [Advenella sp.]